MWRPSTCSPSMDAMSRRATASADRSQPMTLPSDNWIRKSQPPTASLPIECPGHTHGRIILMSVTRGPFVGCTSNNVERLSR